MQKIKTFTALSTGGLDRKVNDFLYTLQDKEIIDIKFSASFGSIYAVVYYKEN